MTDFATMPVLDIIRHFGELPACFVRDCEREAVSASCVQIVNDDGYRYWKWVTTKRESERKAS